MYTTGALNDYRSEDEVSKDFLFEEIASGFTPYVWEERPAKQKYFYPFNQSSSLSCVAGYAGIRLQKLDGSIISRKDVYRRRSNYPMGGMSMPDIMKIIRQGACLEGTLPSQNQGETMMNQNYTLTPQMIQERDKNRGGASFMIQNFRDMDTVAQAFNGGVELCAFWYFDTEGKEWWTVEPKPLFDFTSHFDSDVARHQATIVDMILRNGVKTIIVQDTAGVGTGFGQDNNLRYITPDMLAKRAYSMGFILDNDDEKLTPEPITVRPIFDFTAPIKVGDRGYRVSKLQEVLIYEGLLNIKAPTGYLGGLTRQAVIKLQEKYRAEILTPVGLKYGTGISGKSTLAFLRNKYKCL